MVKPPIIILHGWRVSPKRYFPLKIFFIKAGFEVFIPKLPGFSDDFHFNRAWSLSNYANWLQNYIQKKNLSHFFLIGHSFGGRVAIKLASLYPKRVKALVLTGVPLVRNKKVKRLLFLILAKIGKVLFFSPPFYFFKKAARKFLYLLAGEWDYYKTKGTMRETFKKIVVEDLLPLLPQIKVPTLLIWGENDKMVPVSVAKKMVAKIPKASLIIIPDSSHKLPYENPNFFSKKCLEFFRH